MDFEWTWITHEVNYRWLYHLAIFARPLPRFDAPDLGDSAKWRTSWTYSIRDETGLSQSECLVPAERAYLHRLRQRIFRPDTSCRTQNRRTGAAWCLNASFGVLAMCRAILPSRERSRIPWGMRRVRVASRRSSDQNQDVTAGGGPSCPRSSFGGAGHSFPSLVRLKVSCHKRAFLQRRVPSQHHIWARDETSATADRPFRLARRCS